MCIAHAEIERERIGVLLDVAQSVASNGQTLSTDPKSNLQAGECKKSEEVFLSGQLLIPGLYGLATVILVFKKNGRTRRTTRMVWEERGMAAGGGHQM